MSVARSGWLLPCSARLRRTSEPELLDRLERGTATLEANLRDIRRANRWFGGTRAVMSSLTPFLHNNRNAPVRLLDLATGSADIPAAIIGWAGDHGTTVNIVATDIHGPVLDVARSVGERWGFQVEQADARELPFADGSFDIVTLSLALHHFDPDDARRVLAEMGRVARQMMIVNDLERSWSGYVAAWLFGHVLTSNPMTRNDAPLSVRRAYTADEALALAHQAGWRGARVQRTIPFRYVLTGRPA